MNNIANTIAQSLFNAETNIVDDVKKERVLNSYKSLFYSKDYFSSNRKLYKSSLVLAVICQIITAVSSYSFYDSAESFSLFGIFKPTIIVSLLILLEIGKFILSFYSLKDYFNKPNYFLIGITSILVGWTMYTSIIGGGEIGIDKTKTIKVSDSFDSNREKTLNDYKKEIETIKAEYDVSINDLRLAIKTINHRCTDPRTGNTWIAPKSKERAIVNQKESELSSLLAKKEKTLNDLRLKRDSNIGSIDLNKSNSINKIELENQSSAIKFRIGFCIFDFMFVICSIFNYYYKYNSVLERDVKNKLEEISAKPQKITPTIIEPKENIIVDNEINYPKEETINVRNFSKQEIVSNNIGFVQRFTNKTPIENKKAEVEVKPIEVEVDVQPKKEKEMDKIVYVEVPANSRECDHCKKKFAPIVPKNRFCAGHTCKNAWNHSFKKLKEFLEENKVTDLEGKHKIFFEKIKTQRENRLVNEFFEGLNM